MGCGIYFPIPNFQPITAVFRRVHQRVQYRFGKFELNLGIKKLGARVQGLDFNSLVDRRFRFEVVIEDVKSFIRRREGERICTPPWRSCCER